MQGNARGKYEWRLYQGNAGECRGIQENTG